MFVTQCVAGKEHNTRSSNAFHVMPHSPENVIQLTKRHKAYHAGGDDFDSVIVEWLIKEYLQGVDCREALMIARLRALAEKAKASCMSPGLAAPMILLWCFPGITLSIKHSRDGIIAQHFRNLSFAWGLREAAPVMSQAGADSGADRERPLWCGLAA